MSQPDDLPRPQPLPRDLADAVARASPRLGSVATRIHYFGQVRSTNDVAARLASVGADDGTTVVAGAQTAGRGRLGRTWFSPPGAGLYVSVVVRTAPWLRADARGPVAPALLTLAVGVGLAEGIRAATGLAVEIKWPNDLQVGRRKLGGVLSEAFDLGTPGGFIIVGFGLNLGGAPYPPDIAERATSMEAELGRPVEAGLVFTEALVAFHAWREQLVAGRDAAVLARWRELSPSSTGARIQWTSREGRLEGVTAGVAADGALIVTHAGITERVVAGEVTWLSL